MHQRKFPAIFMRGGSSKGVFFHGRDIPIDNSERDRLFLAAIGSPDPYGRQLDGMGGGISSLSKVVVIDPAERADADVNYTFAQIGVKDPIVDYGSTCGNLSSAVGPFAVDESLVSVSDGEAVIRIFNTNTSIMIHSRFPVSEGSAVVDGDYSMAGVSGSGARVQLDFLDPGGSFTSGVLPAGSVVDVIRVEKYGEIEATLIDVSNPAIYVRASDFGMSGTETPEEIDANTELMEKLDAFRRQGAVMMGLADTPESAGPTSPRIAMVCAPTDYQALDGSEVAARKTSICVRMVSMGNLHRAVPLTGSMSLAAACLIDGSIPNQLADVKDDILVGHPSGILDVGADVAHTDEGWTVRSTRVYRTARRLMEGSVLVPN